MLNLARETFDRLRYRLPEKPKNVQIEVTNRCNMDCPMCPREDLPIHLEHMEWDTFTQVVDRLVDREPLTLTGWGEPFLHPKIFEMIAYCKVRGHRVLITSNGLFAKPDIVDRILQSDLDVLTFSLDSVAGNENVEHGHTNASVNRNIETLAARRDRAKLSLRLQATLHAGCEDDLYGVIRFAGQLGIETVNVGRLDNAHAPDLKRPGPDAEKRIYRTAQSAADAAGVQLDWLQYAVSRGPTRWAYRLLRKRLHRSGKYCLKTFDNAYISREGHVTPCCLLPQAQMGNVLSEDLKSIWQSGKFNEFREHYRDTCGSCDLWTIDQVSPGPAREE